MLKPQKTQISHQNTGTSSVFADERLELSVVVHDLQLDPSSGGTLADSVRELAQFSSPHKVSSYRPQLKSARQTRISVMDDPDELFNLNRRDQLGNKTSWILPIVYAFVMVLRMTGPHMLLPHAHPEFVSILAPGKSFYFMLIPVYLCNAALVVASFTPILRGASIIQHGVSFFFPLINICEYIWQWLIVKSNRVSDAMTLIVINCIFSVLLLINVSHGRNEDLNKIWGSRTHSHQRLKDYWFVEVPCTLQACWSFLLVLVTANYTIVAGNYFFPSSIISQTADIMLTESISINMGSLAGKQMSGAVVTLVFLAVSATAGILSKDGGNAPVAFITAWAAFDWAAAVSRVPDVVQSPQLGWIEPSIDVPALREGCLIIGALSLVAFASCIFIHTLNWTRIWKQRNQNDNYLFSSRNFPTFPTPSTTSGTDYMSRQPNGIQPVSMKRRPSEFLMRSDSSMTEGDTPAVKKT